MHLDQDTKENAGLQSAIDLYDAFHQKIKLLKRVKYICAAKIFILIRNFFYAGRNEYYSVHFGVTYPNTRRNSKSSVTVLSKQNVCTLLSVSCIAVLQSRKINLYIFYLNTLDRGRQ